jgi:hypothetical protein
MLSFFIWQFWAIKIDIMALEFVNLPALLAETVTILVFYIWFEKGKKNCIKENSRKCRDLYKQQETTKFGL